IGSASVLAAGAGCFGWLQAAARRDRARKARICTKSTRGLVSGAMSEEEIIEERRRKAAAMRAAGENPYANDWKPSIELSNLRLRYAHTRPPEGAPVGKQITPVDGVNHRVAGRVLARRGFGKTVFAPIRDAT